MDPPPTPPPASTTSVLDILGEEIVRIVAPVSACMLLVVLLLSALHSSGDGSVDLSFFIADIVDSSGNSSSSLWDKLRDAVINSLAFVGVITLLTFLLVLLFYLRCTSCLKYYLAFSSFVVLAFFGGQISLLLLRRFAVPLDIPTFAVLLLNFAAVGVVSVFSSKVPISVTQGYLVVIGVLVAYWFTLLPEWTTWALLIAVALYDVAAVLLPIGPLRLLLELAMSRDEELPALVYEARPVEPRLDTTRRVWRQRRDLSASSVTTTTTTTLTTNTSTATTTTSIGSSTIAGQAMPETRIVVAEEEVSSGSELTAPLIQGQPERRGEVEDMELAGLGSSGAFKLGLGDFIFYSVLVGRAAQYDFMTVYACYLAILAGLGITLLLLVFYRTAMPALPLSIALGVIFYLLTRVLLEVFVVQSSINLLMF